MKKFAVSLGILLTLERLLTPFPVGAATVQIKPDTTGGAAAEGAAKATSVGKLSLADGQAIIRDHVMDIEVAQPGTAVKKTVLSGVVVKPKVTGSGTKANLSGYVYFRQGAGLAAIDDPGSEELIDIEGGGMVSGHIVSINRDEVEIEQKDGQRRRYPMALVLAIYSPKAFAFNMNINAQDGVNLTQGFQGVANRVVFQSTTHKIPRAPTVSKAGPAVGKIVAIGAVMAGIAAAIAIPIAVAVPLAANKNRRQQPPLFFPPPPPVVEQPPPQGS